MIRILSCCYSTVLLSFLLTISLSDLQTPYANATSKSPYESGYDHGCDDADISDPNDRYINQPEKGPSFHTDEFMRGYNSGYDACSASSGDEESNGSVSNDEGLRVIVHMAGVGLACVYSEKQDLGCNEVDDPGTIEFVFSEGSVETGEEFTACFKDRENEPFYKCETLENRPESEPEHVYSRVS